MKFDPTINTGTIIQTLVVVASMAVAYGSYREDQTKQDGRIAQVEVLAEKDRESTREALREIKGRVDDLQKSNQDIKESLAILRGRAAEPGSRK
ncbi:hypothetical protein [Acidovorax sp. NCPPB 4044]|uniref:hypothetical protein n=1 Tax=Acidovorax sp. NCPPB 4044 TaxID=2940490 RepID=UPI002302CCF7|nr:hypothetical protein [Acidovorax sp. NCPPB 4044]MDA8521969.1 hypothetical protein [Acidovorax sp. NCPPB 4044]